MTTPDSAAPHREAEASGTREERPLASPNIYASVEEQLRHDPRLYHAYMLGRQDAPTPPEADRALREAAESLLHAIESGARIIWSDPTVVALRAALAPRPTPEDRTDAR